MGCRHRLWGLTLTSCPSAQFSDLYYSNFASNCLGHRETTFCPCLPYPVLPSASSERARVKKGVPELGTLLEGDSSTREKEVRVWRHCIDRNSPLRYRHGPSSEIAVSRSLRCDRPEGDIVQSFAVPRREPSTQPD